MRCESMASLSDPHASLTASWNEAAEAITVHVWAGCPGGCSMLVAVCAEGQRLVESERAAWDAFHRARYGEA